MDSGSVTGVLSGVRARSARARGPELIAEKIRAPSSPNSIPMFHVGTTRRDGRPGGMSNLARLAALAIDPGHRRSLLGRRPGRDRAAVRDPSVGLARGLAERQPGSLRRHRTCDRCDRRDPALRPGWRLRDAGLPRQPGADLHALRRRHGHLPEPDEGRPAAGRQRLPPRPVPHRPAVRGADPGDARGRARPGPARDRQGGLPQRPGRRRLDHVVHGQRRRTQEDRVGVCARDRRPEHGRRDPAGRVQEARRLASPTSTRAGRSRPSPTPRRATAGS